ncbi:hypothetical protein RIF29_31336 [Crotalaria pallida]|uniref:Uncharacterized protein n=1 Tax=Crotalaria pallida TaxID=3830 RepID=A0AAN9EHV5_CROPI
MHIMKLFKLRTWLMFHYHSKIKVFDQNLIIKYPTWIRCGACQFVNSDEHESKMGMKLTYTGEGHSVLFEVPQVRDCCLKGMILCVVSSCTPGNMADGCLIGILILNYTKCFIQLYKRDTLSSLNDEECQDIASNLEPHDKVEIFVVFGHRLTVTKIALYLIYGESADGEMEPSLGPTTVEKNAINASWDGANNVVKARSNSK